MKHAPLESRENFMHERRGGAGAAASLAFSLFCACVTHCACQFSVAALVLMGPAVHAVHLVYVASAPPAAVWSVIWEHLSTQRSEESEGHHLALGKGGGGLVCCVP